MPVARPSAETKLTLALVCLSLLSGAVGAELISRGSEERVEAVGATLLSGSAEAFRAQQEAEQEKLAATLDGLMAWRELQAAFEQRDRAGLLRLAAPVLETLRERDRITHWYFHEANGGRRVFLRVHRPDLFGDAVDRTTLRRATETGEVGAGLELGRTAFALRVVRPWTVDGRLIGYMELAEEVDHFLTAMKERTGADYGLLVQKRFIDEKAWAAVLRPRVNSWNARPDVLVVDATDPADGLGSFSGEVGGLPESGRLLGELERSGRVAIRGLFPVADAAGRKVAALYVAHDFTAHHRAAVGGRRQAWTVMMALSVLAAALMVWLARRLVFRPLAHLRQRLERRVAGGAAAGAAGSLQTLDDLGRIEALLERALDRPPRDAAAPQGPDVPGRREVP
jgi:hypothetical protein